MEPTSAADGTRAGQEKVSGFGKLKQLLFFKVKSPVSPSVFAFAATIGTLFILALANCGEVDVGKSNRWTWEVGGAFTTYQKCRMFKDETLCRDNAVDEMQRVNFQPTFWRKDRVKHASEQCSCESNR